MSFQRKEAVWSSPEALSLAWSYSTYSRVCSTCNADLECTHWSFGVLHAQSTLSMILYVLWVHAVKWHWERVQRGGEILPYFSHISAVAIICIGLMNLWRIHCLKGNLTLYLQQHYPDLEGNPAVSLQSVQRAAASQCRSGCCHQHWFSH